MAEMVKARKTRRSSGTVRELILSAARTLFAERGYSASTKEIARLAGVTEGTLFRQFGAKPALFEAAVAQSLLQLYDQFDHSHNPDSENPRNFALRTASFPKEMFNFVEENRALLLAYLSAREFVPEFSAETGPANLARYFDMAENSYLRRYRMLNREPSIPTFILSRLGFVSIFGVALFRDWIFGKEELAEGDLIKALERYVLPDFRPEDFEQTQDAQVIPMPARPAALRSPTSSPAPRAPHPPMDEIAAFVQRMQIALMLKGFDPGAADGELKPQTRLALHAFQTAQGLEPSGDMDLPTLGALGVLK